MAHVTFIHGIGNKPAAEALHNIWLRSLASGLDGINLGAEGITSSMVYWADVLYPEPDSNVSAYESLEASTPKEIDADAHTRIPIPTSIDETAFLSGLAFKLGGYISRSRICGGNPSQPAA